MNKNTIISIVISFSIILFSMYMISPKNDVKINNPGSNYEEANNVFVKDGIQYVTVNARGGYYPRVSNIQSGIPTKLIMKTNNTYDCSSALSIPELKIREMLNPNSEKVIDMGVLESGKTIDGTCSMGMYNFKIQAK